MLRAPAPFGDAEQHLVSDLETETSIESVLPALRQTASYSSNAAVRLHVYVNLDCCDFCSFTFISRDSTLKDPYAHGREFHIHIYGHARYSEQCCVGVQRMIDSSPESPYIHFVAL